MKAFTLFALLLSFPLFAQKIETISWDEASINGKLKLTISKPDFDKRFKKADSIAVATSDDVCGYEEASGVKIVYYKGARFEMDNNIMNFRSVDFRQNRNTYFQIDGDWFDRTTSLKSFARTYPEAAAFMEDHEYGDGEIFDMITLLPEDPNEEYEWRFFFDDGKLQAIECSFCN